MFLWRVSPLETEEGHEFLKVWQDFWEQRIELFSDAFFQTMLQDPELDKAVLARAFWGMGERVLAWWLRERGRVPREVVVRTFARFAAKGLARRLPGQVPRKLEGLSNRAWIGDRPG